MKTLKFPGILKYSLILLAIIGIVSCESNNNWVNPQEYIDAEQKLLEEYYSEVLDNGMTRLESMTAAAFDTVDNRRESGLMLFHTSVTDGDSVGLFTEVGFRYKLYTIDRDTLDNIIEVVQDSNFYKPSPSVFTTYILNDGASAQQYGVYFGVNEAIQHMREGSKATIIIPSNLTFSPNSYKTFKYELEVTYLKH